LGKVLTTLVSVKTVEKRLSLRERVAMPEVIETGREKYLIRSYKLQN
jgi:hypothetical protein